MDEPRHGTIVSGEVIPPQTYLHKVAAAKRDDPADEAEENIATAAEDTAAEDTAPEDTAADHAGRTGDIADDTGTAETHDFHAADDEDDDDGFAADTIAMPAAAAEPDAAETDATESRDQRDGILETDAARATAAQQDTGATASAATDSGLTDAGQADAGQADAGMHATDTAAVDATRPDLVAPEAPGAAKPREGRPGDLPVPEDVSLIGDGAAIREQWMRVQASFVDDPRAAVSAAAGVITDAAARVETAVRERQRALRDRWDSEGRPDTEELRVTMQQYRQLLERLAAL